jgi:hypothetical protein
VSDVVSILYLAGSLCFFFGTLLGWLHQKGLIG